MIPGSGRLQSKLTNACWPWTPVPVPSRARSPCGILRALLLQPRCFSASLVPCRLSQVKPTRTSPA
jgi:hypothetical protein